MEGKYKEKLYRRRKLKAKRQIIILIWSVTFAYLSLTATDADSPNSGRTRRSNPSDENDVYPERGASYFPNGERPILRQNPPTDDPPTGTPAQGTNEPIRVTNGFLSSTSIGGGGLSTDSSNTLAAATGSPGTGNDRFIDGTETTEGGKGIEELIPGVNCTPPAIDDFPTDLFTQAERQKGYVAIHFLASVYIFYCLAVVCDEYFVPSIECICEELHLPSDVAGATFMAVATSSPELFTNIVGTFITQGDIGVGTIVGSAVFNILGVGACCGLAAKTALPLEWYPLTRDCLFYSVSVILLIVFLKNGRVFWYEALVLVLFYCVYILVMYKNAALRNWAENSVSNLRSRFGYSNDDDVNSVKAAKKRRASFVAELAASSEEKRPLLGSGRDLENAPPEKGWLGESLDKSGDIPAAVLDEMLISSALQKSHAQAVEEDVCSGNRDKSNFKSQEAEDNSILNSKEKGNEAWSLFGKSDAIMWKRKGKRESFNFMKFVLLIGAIVNASAEWSLIHVPCSEGFVVVLQWILTWPSRFIFGFTIPDCRDDNLRRLYPITFFMCIVYIAALSYLVSWTMTVIGHTFSIPDSVMGLTFIAAGTSIPEAVSSVIVARQGLGTMSISNSIGSNTFDILMCLGLPWLIKGSIIWTDPERNWIQINSGGLEYSTITLLFSLSMMYLILACNKFYLDKKVGIIALLLYACFLVFASMFEMNVFITVNQPQCDSIYE